MRASRRCGFSSPLFSLPPPGESCLTLSSLHHFLSLIGQLQSDLVSKQQISHLFYASRLLQERNTVSVAFFPLLKCREERMHQGLYPAGLILGERAARKLSCQAQSPPTRLPLAAVIRLRKNNNRDKINNFKLNVLGTYLSNKHSAVWLQK